MVTCATFCQLSEPPVRVGAVGAVRSRRMVLPAVGAAGIHAELKPAASTARNWTMVSPWALMATVLPVPGAPQVVPPSMEVWYW